MEMNEQDKESWRFYSKIWLHVLLDVLQWSPRRAASYIGWLRRLYNRNPAKLYGFNFFYDPPSRFLFRAIMDKELQKRWDGKENISPYSLFQILIRAICGGPETNFEKENFSWNKARIRYKRKRKWVENWIDSRKSIKKRVKAS